MSKRKGNIFEVFIFQFTLCSLGLAQNCVKIDRCSCQLDDGKGIIDLSSIGKQGGIPLIQDISAGDTYAYSFNPCYPFNEGTCHNVSGCQIDPTGLVYYDIGSADKVTFSYDEANDSLVGTYVAGAGARKSIVKYVCDPSVDPPQAIIGGEISPSTYSFTITSKHACPRSEQTGNCTQLDPCSCRFDDGRGLVDLSRLGTHGTPLIQNSKAGLYYYSFNPCFPFDEGTCKGVAGCQLENTSGIYIEIANAYKVNLFYDGSNIVGNYTSADGSRNTVVTYVCDPVIESPIVVVNGEICTTTYVFTIVSREVCPKKGILNPSNARGNELSP